MCKTYAPLTSKTSLRAPHLQCHRVVRGPTLLAWVPLTASWLVSFLPLLFRYVHSLHSSLSNPLTT